MKLKKAGAPAPQSENPLGYLPVNQDKNTNFHSEKHRIIRQHFGVTNIVNLYLSTINS